MKGLRQLALLFIFCIFSPLIYAQQFDWVRGGGSTDPNLTLSDQMEAAKFLCTDGNGNIYALSNIGTGAVAADTFYNSGAPAGPNMLITSYTCNGQMRWAKLISSNAGQCYPYGIAVDNLGHVYVAGYFTNNTLYIGTDVSITGHQYQNNGLIQFDTLGHYNWIEYIGDNTLATLSHETVFGYALFTDGTNNVHMINTTKSGLHITPSLTTQYGEYEVVYDQMGTFINAKRLDLDSVWYLHSFAFDAVNSKLYITGERNFNLPGADPNERFFLSAFDANRNRIWMDSTGDFSGLSSVVYDGIGHLYFNGAAQLAAFTYKNFSGPNIGSTIVLKTDTVGNPIWLQNNSISGNGTNSCAFNSLAILPNNLIASAGFFGTTLTDGIHTIICPQAGNNPFLSILDTSGVPMSLYQLYGDGFYDWSRSITSDKIGNIYVGGQVEDSIFEPNIAAYHTYGGNTDFFVMKYGMDCDCTSMPVANFSDVVNQFTTNYTYNGSIANIDSVTWNFGDGQTAIGITPSHTYPAVPQGQYVDYEVCVTAYTFCGNDMHCSRVRINGPVSVANVSNEDGVQVYPNPSKDELKIVAPGYDSYKLLTVSSGSVLSGTLQQGNSEISMKNVSSGMYLLQLKSAKGAVKVVKVVKE